MQINQILAKKDQVDLIWTLITQSFKSKKDL